jgi:branched-subunit amino acid aminotransferase/4-amino-4-deoxychorismate lyase
MDQAELYGKGVFSTVRITAGKPFLWGKHWRRLERDAGAIKLDLSGHTELSTRSELERVMNASSMVNGRARITFSDASPSDLWPSEAEGGTRLAIITGEMRPAPHPFKLTISQYPMNARSPLAGVKSSNYLDHLISLDEARQRGFHEAIRVNERGVVTSGCMANVFWLKNGQLFTPSLSTGCLPGTTREFVLENVECAEVEAGIDDLRRADAIFLTSAGLGVTEVAELGSRQIGAPRHPIAELLSRT